MRISLIAPFRTEINFDTRIALHEHERIEKLLGNCIEQSSCSKFNWTIPSGKGLKSGAQFSNLDDICVPDTAKPNLRLEVCAINNELAATPLFKANYFIENIKIISVDAYYFDNTIGVLVVQLGLVKTMPQDSFNSEFDDFTNELCGHYLSIISETESEIINSIQIEDTKLGLGFFKARENYDIFSDYNELQNQDPANRLMWVSRIAFVGEEHDLPASMLTWMRIDSLRSNFAIEGLKGHINVGNSLFIGESKEKESKIIIESYLFCNYFYSLYDILNKELRELFIKESIVKKPKNQTVSRVIKVQEYVQFINSEFDDYLIGIQGIHSKTAKVLTETWKINNLIEAISRKLNMINTFVDRIIKERSRKYNKIIESVLVAIAGVSLLDFTLSFFKYNQLSVDSASSLFGVFNLLKFMGVDAALHITILMLIVVSLMVIRKR